MIYRFFVGFFLLLFSFIPVSIHAQEEIYEPAQVIESPVSTAESTSAKKLVKDKVVENTDAQSSVAKRKERLQRIRIGPNIGLQFGTFTYINISPTVGYMVIRKRLELGGGPIFIYQRYKFSTADVFSFFVYGVDIYARGYLWKGLYLESRYDVVNKPSYEDFSRRIFVNHLLLGLGYSTAIGKVGSFNISAVYNVLNNRESIYRGTFGNFPLIMNFGFGFGLGGK